MSFKYVGRVHFQDTDAAGVVYFSHVLNFCHAAYEESLGHTGIELKSFFSASASVVIPIIHASVDFVHPLYCGDHFMVELNPRLMTTHSFIVAYEIFVDEQDPQLTVKASTKHVCINPQTRQKTPIPDPIVNWFNQWSSGDTIA